MTLLKCPDRPLTARRAAARTVFAVGLLGALAVGTGPSAAQTEAPAGPEQAPGSASEAAPAKVRITKQDCELMLRHQPSADVAYKPGVDVRGKKVAPADLSGGFQMVLPDVFEFNVTKDLQAYLGGAEETLAAQKAAALAAQKSTAATDAAVSSAGLSLSGAKDIYDSAVATATAAQAAADAAPNDATLAATAASAQAAATAAGSHLATTQAGYAATVNAAAANNVGAALSGADATLAAARGMGYAQDTAALTASSKAATAAQAASAADAAALAAQEKVSKNAGMELTIGTVRFDINTGAMTFNGQPLNAAARGDLVAVCREIMAGGK